MTGASQPLRHGRMRADLEVLGALSPCWFGRNRVLPMRLAGLRTLDRGAYWAAWGSNARGAKGVFYVT